MQGKGELTFKTTKKKAEGEEEDGDAVGFQKEDVRACYMHFLFFFIMLITIVYAIVKAVVAQDVKFYYYYMYMIGKFLLKFTLVSVQAKIYAQS